MKPTFVLFVIIHVLEAVGIIWYSVSTSIYDSKYIAKVIQVPENMVLTTANDISYSVNREKRLLFLRVLKSHQTGYLAIASILLMMDMVIFLQTGMILLSKISLKNLRISLRKKGSTIKKNMCSEVALSAFA